jgi:hypothetical protein
MQGKVPRAGLPSTLQTHLLGSQHRETSSRHLHIHPHDILTYQSSKMRTTMTLLAFLAMTYTSTIAAPMPVEQLQVQPNSLYAGPGNYSLTRLFQTRDIDTSEIIKYLRRR